ncbi:o-succinylbenzoate synthase [Hymenobacter busanensis]|uniref:O-succinylbenzoate synthase n=1 Tax=Hymenobacter busanensis TaxID=2607656 RepID=A0A7L4ZSD4_9BACT|nr:o-succinylbenzoate synthase [Hymenobacter busanensis]KAA9327132.1 o-succinylbenzoate synthase [Hymenobacter busanensis]QHJ05797.1 o-succinylbenzoate synthase [Hymenobacter busanensis]
MPLRLHYSRRALQFNFPARTSRGALTEHVAWYLHLTDPAYPDQQAVGEAAPLAGLSPDYHPGFETRLQRLCADFSAAQLTDATAVNPADWVEPEWPALRFGLETALLDWAGGGRHQLFDNAFSRGEAGIPINGLVWMGDAVFMGEQIQKKLAEGFSCLKMKIGGLDFATECALLDHIRRVASPAELVLRVDANGAFAPAEAPEKLARLARYALHSIEQPIRAGQPEALAALCRTSPVPIALDEELIGVTDPRQQAALLDATQPAYVVLKPTLLGGLAATRHWIELAAARGIGWWITSALESNVGLNAISQFTAQYDLLGMAQGLGTGQLYHNNVASPLQVADGALHYRPALPWEL